MPQLTWKNYGGTNKLEKNNNITTSSLITDNFSLRKAYLGNFDISGTLYVSGNIYVSTDTLVNGNVDISNNIFVKGNSYLNQNLFVSKDAVIDGSVNIFNELFLGDTKQMYLYGTPTGIGINTHNPLAILDISGSREQILNVFSSNPINTNIIAQNQNQNGIVVSSNDISSCIQFYNDNSIGSTTAADAQIKYILGGNLIINTTGNSIINSQFVVSNRLTKDHVFNEQAIIYDISAGPYLKDYYQKPEYNTGNALSLISNNNNSNTFLNIANPNKMGLAIGGGSIILPTDPISRSMGTIGLTNINGNYIPVQTLVLGNNIISQRATVGINKYNPITEKYVLDINGPVHIDNGEIVNVNNIPFKINCTDSNGEFIVSVGNYAYSYIDSFNQTKYTYIINYSNNGGKTWNQYNLMDVDSDLNIIQIPFNTVYVYNSSYAIIGGNNGFIYFTNNSGQNWYGIRGSGTSANITSIIIEELNLKYFVKIAYINFTEYTFTLSNIYNLSGTITLQTSNANANYYYQIVGGISNILVKSMSNLINYTCYAGNYVLNSVINGSGSIIIQYFNGSSNTTHIAINHVYNKIKTKYDSSTQLYIIIAVGNGIISSATSNSGTFSVFNDITTFNSIIFNDVFIYDSFRAIACGNGSAFYYSVDGFQTWNSVNPQMLNTTGISNVLTNLSQNFVNIYMNDLNSFIITNVLPDSSSNIFYCYLPNLLNHKNNKVLDICGNMQLSGDLTVDNNVYAQENLYVGWDTSMNGNAFIRKKLTVAYDSSLNGNLYVGLDSSMNGNVFIQKKLTVAYDSSLNGNLYVGLDASMNGNVFIQKKLTVAYDSSLNGNLVVGLDAMVNGNIYNKGNLFTNYIDFYNSNLNIGTNSQSQDINIGNSNSTVNITGQNVNITGGVIQNIGQLETTLHTILLNDGVIEPYGVSAGSGIRIRDNDIDNASFMLISNDMNGLLVKTTNSPNVLNINTGNIQLTDTSIGVGLVTLKKSVADINGILDSSFTMMASNIDVSNIMLKDWRVSDQYTQTATTNIRIFGNTDICGNLYIHNQTNSTGINTGAFQIKNGGGASVSGNLFVGGILHVDSPIIVNKLATSINPNMIMDISGNATITRMGLNLSAIDDNATLAIKGNIIQTFGFIQQF